MSQKIKTYLKISCEKPAMDENVFHSEHGPEEKFPGTIMQKMVYKRTNQIFFFQNHLHFGTTWVIILYENNFVQQ